MSVYDNPTGIRAYEELDPLTDTERAVYLPPNFDRIMRNWSRSYAQRINQIIYGK